MLMFSSESFNSVWSTFKTLISFAFISVNRLENVLFCVFVCVCVCVCVCVAVHFSQYHLLKDFFCIYILASFAIDLVTMCGLISGISILSHWSVFLFLCQYHTLLMTVALQYSLKSGQLIPPALFFFLKIALAIWSLLCSHTNYKNLYSNSVKTALVI